MLRKRDVAALVAVSLSAGAAFAASIPEERQRELVANIAVSLLGLSPAGVELWVDHVMTSRGDDRYVRSSQLMRSIGEQLALDAPDRARLDAPGDEQAEAAARLARLEHDQLMDIAFRLSDEDRKVLGQRLVTNAEADLAKAPTHPDPLP